MTQKETILQMLREAPNRTVSCSEFAKVYAYHKLSSRCSDLKKLGHDIVFIKSDSIMSSKYWLKFDAERDGKYEFEGDQLRFA